MKIILFGGSFDPIHNAHIKIAKQAFSQIKADKLIFVPCKKNKNKELKAHGIDRFNMINLAIRDIENFEVSDYEITNKFEYSYTVDLLDYYQNKYPNDEIYFLMGNDQLENIRSWKNYERVLFRYKILVYPRNYKVNNFLVEFANVKIIKGEMYQESSSDFKESGDISLIPNIVLKYIVMNGIYYDSILPKYEKESRYLHSVRVAHMMKQLFKDDSYDNQMIANTIGLYHDLCKCYDKEYLEYLAYDVIGLKKTDYKLLHGPVASYILNKVFGITNVDILNAVARHTKPLDYGSGPLSIFDKAIYCCDKLEPCRTDEDVNNIEYYRDLLFNDIDQCFEELMVAINKQYK